MPQRIGLVADPKTLTDHQLVQDLMNAEFDALKRSTLIKVYKILFKPHLNVGNLGDSIITDPRNLNSTDLVDLIYKSGYHLGAFAHLSRAGLEKAYKHIFGFPSTPAGSPASRHSTPPSSHHSTPRSHHSMIADMVMDFPELPASPRRSPRRSPQLLALPAPPASPPRRSPQRLPVGSPLLALVAPQPIITGSVEDYNARFDFFQRHFAEKTKNDLVSLILKKGGYADLHMTKAELLNIASDIGAKNMINKALKAPK